MNPFRFPEPVSDRADALRATAWIVACVVLGIAFNALGIVRAMSGAF